MKRDSLIFWISTGLLGAMMLFSGYSYFSDPKVADGFQHLGFPSYFRYELGIAKIAGAIALLIPQVPRIVKGFTYAGFAIVFISATIAHLAGGDGIGMASAPAVFLAVLSVSYYYFQKSGAKLAREVARNK